MRIPQSKRWVSRHQDRFEGRCETEAAPPLGRLRPDQGGSTSLHMAFECPRTHERRALEECAHCRYFVDFRPRAEHRSVVLTCACSDADPVLDSADTRRAWPTVDPRAPLGDALHLASVHEAPLLVVVHRGGVLGVVYRQDLEDSRAPLSTRLTQYPWSLSSRATLGDAVDALATVFAPALLVLAPDTELVGVVSRDHLERLGVPLERLYRAEAGRHAP